MSTKRFDFAYTEAPLVELPTSIQTLAEEALKSTSLSYAPFSGFHVGCAVLLDNGEVVVGANQENASYPCGLCAERVALYNASTLHPKAKIVALSLRCMPSSSGRIRCPPRVTHRCGDGRPNPHGMGTRCPLPATLHIQALRPQQKPLKRCGTQHCYGFRLMGISTNPI